MVDLLNESVPGEQPPDFSFWDNIYQSDAVEHPERQSAQHAMR
jgi:hypothetical protein